MVSWPLTKTFAGKSHGLLGSKQIGFIPCIRECAFALDPRVRNFKRGKRFASISPLSNKEQRARTKQSQDTDEATSKLPKRMVWDAKQDTELSTLFRGNQIDPDLPHFKDNKKEDSKYLNHLTKGEYISYSVIRWFRQKCVACTTGLVDGGVRRRRNTTDGSKFHVFVERVCISTEALITRVDV